MSSSTAHATDTGMPAIDGSDGGWVTSRRWILGGAAVLLVATGIVLARNDPFSSSVTARGVVHDNSYPTSLATVTRRTLSSTMPENATLGYAGSYTAINRGSGTYTWLPAPGQVITQGQALYRLDGTPVILLYGSMPAYRNLSPGSSGTDVRQLNADLVALGYAHARALSQASDSFGQTTAAGVKKLQAHLGLAQTGILALGQVVFLPGAARVASILTDDGVALGAPACSGPPGCSGQPVLTATSTTRQVTINLDAGQQSYVRVDNRVAITLPNNATTRGVVSSVSKVAIASGSSTPTVTVEVRPTHPADTGTLDRAPVQVAITTATVHNTLTVPVDAIIALSGGGNAVEVANPDGVHHLVHVALGIFDDADGRVQVSGSGLAAGQRVVVPGL